ncbi:ATP-grasp domain-containing protein [Psychroserpens mesophilus]|uniref:ATP-grasp domain-containing protein n=1 Tax=Psychroserpens mesophilus TaxID=325473 RepID=UPI003D645B5C
MLTYDCVILTDQRYLNDSKTDAYKHNVYVEDRLVYHALEELGLKTLRLAWDDMFFDWSSTTSVLFRTTWDYFDRFEEFSKWLETVSKQTTLLNSEAIIRWNIDKHYLLDLQRKGIHIAESHFIEQGAKVTLAQLHDILNWKDTVLKPCISGAARHTYKLNPENLKAYESTFQKLIAAEAMMLQPFQHHIVSKGEVSMMVFNGQFSHAILKKAKAGDFRVQDDFGGSVHNYTPTLEEIEFAEASVKACDELPIYARVDIFEDNDGQIALSELELIEPELWFRHHPEAAKLLAKSIKNKLTHDH